MGAKVTKCARVPRVHMPQSQHQPRDNLSTNQEPPPQATTLMKGYTDERPPHIGQGTICMERTCETCAGNISRSVPSLPA